MPRSALPDHLNDPEEIEAAFPDDSKSGALWRKFKKTTKHWFVFGPRCHEWWARWREFPRTIIAFGDSFGQWRIETDLDQFYIEYKFLFLPHQKYAYLSRVQYAKKWHVQVQWPLFVEVQVKTWEGYLGFKRDADKVYWLSAFIGRTWK